MDPLALGCVALAAVLHAAWNILIKTAGDPLRSATAGMVTAALVFAPLVVVGWLATGQPDIPPTAWAFGVASGAVEVAYFVFLAAAYRRGDLSVVYPLARGSGPLLAVAIGIGVLGERLVPAALIGVALLVVGLIVVQRPWRLLRGAAASDRSAAGYALLTGATIATYSALDRVGVRMAPAWAYAGILFAAGAVGLVIVELVRARMPLPVLAAPGGPSVAPGAAAAVPLDRRAAARAAPVAAPLDRRAAIAGGILMFAAYGLVLVALSRAELAIVAPLRESAVLLASGWGVLRLREARSRDEVVLRLAGSALVLTGAAALAIAR